MIVSYKFDELISAIQAVMPHCAGKNEVSDIVTGIHIAADGTLLATDRYTVGRYKPESFEAYDADPNASVEWTNVNADASLTFEGFTLSPAAVLWLSKLKPVEKYGQYRAHLQDDVDGPNVRILMVDSDGNAVQQGVFPLLIGNYPPVARLFPESLDAFTGVPTLNLKLAFLIRIDKAVKVLNPRENNGCARFHFQANADTHKPGPVYVTVGDRFDALVQPNLLLR